MITDITKIKILSKQNEAENVEFRSFLKFVDDPDEVDDRVHDLFDKLSSEIDCTKCANCCKEITPVVLDEDINRLSKFTELDESRFINEYLIKDDEDDYLIEKSPCPFLKNNLCTCYDMRPQACISYPHLQKDDFTSRQYGVIYNCSVCPIVFNLYEILKDELWDRNYKY